MTEIPSVVACRAVRPQDYDDFRKKIWNDAIARGLTPPPDYPGSIAMPCGECGIDVQVGPRQQEMLKTQAADIICLVCVPFAMRRDGQQPTIINLGNPYKE